jgi:hypothetical protein
MLLLLLLLLLRLDSYICNDSNDTITYSLSTSMLLLSDNNKNIYWSITIYGNDYEGLLSSSLSIYDTKQQVTIICNDINLDINSCNLLYDHINNEYNTRCNISLISISSRHFIYENDCYYSSFYSSLPSLRYYNNDSILLSSSLLSYSSSSSLYNTINSNDMIGVDAIYVMHWDHNDNRHDKIRPVKEWLGTHNISSLWVTDFDGEALECKVTIHYYYYY